MVRLGDHDVDGFGLVGIVLISYSGKSIRWGVYQVIGSLIGILGARSIGGPLGYIPVGRSLGSSIGRLCSIRAWSWWPRLRGLIGGL